MQPAHLLLQILLAFLSISQLSFEEGKGLSLTVGFTLLKRRVFRGSLMPSLDVDDLNSNPAGSLSYHVA